MRMNGVLAHNRILVFHGSFSFHPALPLPTYAAKHSATRHIANASAITRSRILVPESQVLKGPMSPGAREGRDGSFEESNEVEGRNKVLLLELRGHQRRSEEQERRLETSSGVFNLK